jgi:beta-N-acetylhexosaminidase
MSLTLEQAIGQKLMLSFSGATPSPEILAALQERHVAGITLFRAHNVVDPAQVRALNDALQQAARASGQPPLLIAADQEGGTLFALAGTTPFAGNLALGATRPAELAYRTGYATARELAAMGINVNYAPVCDVSVSHRNPVVGPRSFGSDPQLVAELGAAMIRGSQDAGVAATAKHFPGHGGTALDSHYGTPVLWRDTEQLRQTELPPFVAAVEAGVKLVMTGHIALPLLNSGSDVPATLSPAVLRGLLRGELGFRGVIASDALDMHAIRQGPAFLIDAIAAVAAGVDLLTLTIHVSERLSVYDALLQAAKRRLLAPADVLASAERVLALKHWCTQTEQPRLDVIGCAEHRALAFEVASRALTLVRDDAKRIPLRLPAGARIAVVLPTPRDLTPADTSSYDTPMLAKAVRGFHTATDELSTTINPADGEVAALREQLRRYELVIVGTLNAREHRGQAALVNALLADGVATIAAALRMPEDVLAYPAAPTYICAYSLQPPSMDALAQALWGEIPFLGRLPIPIFEVE